MTSDRLARDYCRRARLRRRAAETLASEAAYADVVREAQEIIELVFKGALRFVGVDPPRRHDVTSTLRRHLARLPAAWRQALEDSADDLARLAEDRGPSFYGDEESLVGASDMFTAEDATRALQLVDRFLVLFEVLVASTTDDRR